MWSTGIKLKYKEKRGERVYSFFFFFFLAFFPQCFLHPLLPLQTKKEHCLELTDAAIRIHALCLRPDLRTKNIDIERYQSQKRQKRRFANGTR